MTNTLVILNTGDIPAATAVAARLTDPHVLVFDPALVDRLAGAGLGPVECLPWTQGPSYRRLFDDAHKLARICELSLDPLVAAHCPGVSIRAWQHLSLTYLHLGLLWYAPLAQALLPQLAGRTLHVPIYDNAQSFYHPSFVPGLLLLQQAQRLGLAAQAYSYGSQADPGPMVPDLRELPPPPAGDYLLTHLPTCMYDVPYINRELQATGKPVVDLKARLWNIAVETPLQVSVAPVAALQDRLPPPVLAAIDALTPRLAQALDQHLARWLGSPSYRQRQAERLAAVYRAQLITNQLLEQHFGAAPPSKLLLSDHDADFHGPLLAFAQRHHRPLLVLPHSKTSGDLDYSYANTVALYHPIQGESVHDPDGRRVAQFALDLPTQLQFDTERLPRLQRLGLLLNAISLNGVPMVDVDLYLDGIRRCAQWCAEHGVELRIRFKPGYTMVEALAGTAPGLDRESLLRHMQGSMTDFALGCDLCLMLGTPTSGALELLTRSVPILNPMAGELSQPQAATIDPAVVPRLDLDETMRRVGQYLADPLEFQRFRRQQFLAFAARFADVHALRRLL